MSSAEFFIKNKLYSWIVIIASFAFGMTAYYGMPRFEDPEFLIRTAQIVTEYPGASPEEVTNEVANVIETEIQGMQEVDKITSTSYYGYSIISVDIKHAFAKNQKELNVVWTRLRNKVDDAKAQLPPGSGQPIINDDYGDVYGLYYVVTGEGYTTTELYEYAKNLRKDLLSVDGVAKVTLLGKQQEVIEVNVSKDRAANLGLSINDVFYDLSQQNSVIPAGNILLGDQRIAIYPVGQLNTIEAIKNVVISISNSTELVRLEEIAEITRTIQDPVSILTRFNGKPSLVLGISNVSGVNVVEVGETIRSKIEDVADNKPLGMEISEFYHQGDAVDQSITDFALNVLVALIIVLVTLLLFMGLQSAIIIGAVLSITIAATLATMDLAGIPMHRISLGALIIALGMLVDNAIVVTEGILIGVKKGNSVLKSAKGIVGRTQWALLGGTVVGILAFAPVGFAPGDTAEYTNHLFWVIFISLAYSWIFAITLAPMVASLVFKTKDAKPKGEIKEGGLMRAYKSLMDKVLKLRWAVISAAFILFIIAGWGFSFVKEGFFPTSTTPQIAVDYWLPEGTDIGATARDMAVIEKEVQSYEGIESMHSIIGAGALRYMLIYSPEFDNSAYGQIILKVDDLDKIDDLIGKIQNFIDNELPAAQARVWRFTLGPSQGSKIQAAFSGPDPSILRELSAQAKELIVKNVKATAVKTDWRQKVSVIKPEYDPARGSRVGISREDFSNALQTTYSGSIIGVYRDNDELLPIIARSPKEERSELSMATEIQIPSQLTGKTVPLSEVLADQKIVWENSQMLRENRVWMIKVKADPIPGVMASELLNEVKAQVEGIELPPGYALRWDGEYGDSLKANAELAQTIPAGLIAMILVVVLLFNAIRQALVIWLIVPMGIIGVVWGLVLTDTPLEFMAILGLLSLSGLLIKNAIVLVDQMDAEIKEGKPRYEAVIDSAASRVRPVLMGALTTIFGVIPLLGDVFFASMAVVIVFGLSFATLLTLIVLPALYAVFFNIQSSEKKALMTEGV